MSRNGHQLRTKGRKNVAFNTELSLLAHYCDYAMVYPVDKMQMVSESWKVVLHSQQLWHFHSRC